MGSNADRLLWLCLRIDWRLPRVMRKRKRRGDNNNGDAQAAKYPANQRSAWPLAILMRGSGRLGITTESEIRMRKRLQNPIRVVDLPEFFFGFLAQPQIAAKAIRMPNFHQVAVRFLDLCGCRAWIQSQNIERILM
jgi:hypothetical protein